MNNIEEQLWEYIDGNCSADDYKAIDQLIEQDITWRDKYLELLAFNREIAAMELDEPSMAFTYNVMETIRTEEAQKPLKAAIDKRITNGIAGFFMITILTLVIVMLMNVNWSAGNTVAPVAVKVPDLTKFLSKPVLQGLLFFDAILLLLLFDTLLHNKKFIKTNANV